MADFDWNNTVTNTIFPTTGVEQTTWIKSQVMKVGILPIQVVVPESKLCKIGVSDSRTMKYLESYNDS